MKNIFLSTKHLAAAIVRSTKYLKMLSLKQYLKMLHVMFLIRETNDATVKDDLYKRANDILSDYCCFTLLKDFDCQFPIITNQKSNGKEPIWICWLQGKDNLPESSKICYNSVLRHSNSHPVIFLDNENLTEYISIPDNIKQLFLSNKIRPAIYVDYIRCALLAKYGGLWLDSTILLTSDISEEAFETEFFSIKSIRCDHLSVSYYRWATFVMGTTKDSHFFKLIKEIFEYYFSKYDTNFVYTMIDFFFDSIYRKNKYFKKYIDERKISNPLIHGSGFFLNLEYSDKCWRDIIKDTSFIKMTYKRKWQKLSPNGKDTIYNFLLNKYNK